uniref:Integrase catalytic domain-containing protein n=1 Tax=Lactuca sativa TaxID=4236 RepID=A0A9R1VTZ3_LACSA|nr:hypothetical protein LSAT_V11C400168580 [Lactuca sativa]
MNLHHVNDSTEVACIMLATMTPELQKTFEFHEAFEMIEQLSHAKQDRFETLNAFIGCKMDKGSFVRSHEMSINELHNLLKIVVKNVKKSGNNQVLMIHEVLISVRGKEKLPRKARARERVKGSLLPLTQLLNPSLLLMLIALNVMKMNIGSATVPNTYRNLRRSKPTSLAPQGLRNVRELRDGDLELHVGNGNRVAIKAIGQYHLFLPNVLNLIFNNCCYVPSITRNIISTSRLYEQGCRYKFDFDFENIFVFKDNVFYFETSPTNGIYEIDLNGSYTKDNSIFNLNKKTKLDSNKTFFWHCRLGHISKTSITKLQKDVILESTGSKSFDVCESCICGKMTKALFTGVGERASDLLGLIHTDLCGPFRTMTISDRGGEYLRYEFDEHLKNCDIVSQLTPPGTPQHNGVSEIRNHTLLDMVRSMMSDTSLPHLFWGYALETAVRTSCWKQVDLQEEDLHGRKCTQIQGVDYEDTFSPFAKIESIRIIMAIAAYYDYEIWQMDVKTTFLNGYLEEDVFMEQSEGIVKPDNLKKVRKLKKSIYGLKQASGVWYHRFDEKCWVLSILTLLWCTCNPKYLGSMFSLLYMKYQFPRYLS